MHDLVDLHISEAFDELANYNAGFLLPQASSLLKQAGKVEAVGILLNHVYFGRSLYRLTMLHTVRALHEAVDLDFLENGLHFRFSKGLSIDNFARIDGLCGVYS